MFAAILSALLLLADGSSSASLSGHVVGPDGSPVNGATVMVYTAAPKKGSPTTNPTESPDCGKISTTDAGGAFAIDGVDSTQLFELLVLTDADRPLMLKKVDPARGQITAKLKSLPADVDPTLVVKGRIVDANGKPAVGAKVEVCAYQEGNSTTFGGESSVIEPLTYTNAKGEFTLVAKKSGLTFNMLIHSRDAAPMIITRLAAGDDIHEFGTTSGARVTGRIVKDGQPLASIKLDLVQQDRNSETFLDVVSAWTDDTGRFTFPHVHPDLRYDVTPTTKTLAGRGWLEPAPVQASGDDTAVDLGDIALQPGQTISGQLVASSGSPDWSEAKLTIGRGDTWDDVLDVPVGKDGQFEIKGVGGLCDLSLKYNGFHLSKDNLSAEPYRAKYLEGRLDQDISDLKIKIDPGPVEQISNQYNQSVFQRLSTSTLSGVESK